MSYVVKRCQECTSEPGRVDVEWGIQGSEADNVNLFGENINIIYEQNQRSLISCYKKGGLEEYVEQTQHIFMPLPQEAEQYISMNFPNKSYPNVAKASMWE